MFPFYIFKIEADGIPIWCEGAETFEAAELRVAALTVSHPAKYTILSRDTDRPDAPGAPSRANPQGR
jgi:hypothetical protein